MKLTNQLLQYSEQERLALISCIASIATIDKEANEEEIDFILALIEAADLDAMKMKSVIEAAKDPKNTILKNSVEIIACNENSRYFFTNEILPFIKDNNELNNKTNVKHILTKLETTKKTKDAALDKQVEDEKLVDGSFLEQVVMSLYLK